MPTPLYPDDLGSDLASIRATLRAALVLARSGAAKTKILAAAIELLGRLLIKAGGRLEVQNAAGNGLMLAGQIPLSDGTMADGLAVFRPGGQVALAAFQSGANFLPVLYDLAGNRVMFPDEIAGQGLARPRLTHSLYPTDFTTMASSTSATFETLWTGGYWKQQDSLHVFGRMGSDTATGGELRVLANGVQLGATITIPVFVNTTWDLTPLAVPGGYLDYTQIEIQIRRTSGAGAVKCAPIMMVSREAS
jgi:hypothetical protein